MRPWIEKAQVTVQSGDGLVGRWPGIILVIPGGPYMGSVLERLFVDDAEVPAPEVLRERVEALDPSQPVALVLEQPQPDRIWIYGSRVSCRAAGKALSDGGATVTAAPLRIGKTTPDVRAVHPVAGLMVGLVPGAGVVVDTRSSDGEAAGGGVEALGASSLGKIVFDDGAEYRLDHGYVIGRETGVELPAGFRPIVLSDAENTVSRVHAELEIRDQSVVLTDLGSTNGTHILDAVSGQWSRLVPNVPAVLEPGARVAVGGRQFVLETP